VFADQAFDIQSFKVSYDERDMVFTFTFFGPVPNPWGSTSGLSLQTLDVYVDKDPGQSSGAKLLLPGRNGALTEEDGWEVAVWAEGWYPDIFAPDSTSGAPKSLGVAPKIIVDSGQKTVTIRVPRAVFGEGDPSAWGYAGMVLSQDGFPAKGVWRVRDVEVENSQWRLGGASADTNHTRIVDLAWQEEDGITQAAILGTYPASDQSPDQLTADDFAQIPLIKQSP
jgi:carbohydrate-binding DOMON domain-containing protein